MSRFLLRIEKVMEGCNVRVGLQGGPYGAAVVIGRAEDADFRIDDVTISSHHVRIAPGEEPQPTAFRIESLTERGTTFVDGARLEGGRATFVEGTESWLQLGKVLIRLGLELETVPVERAMSVPDSGDDSPQPLVALRIMGTHCEVRLRGSAVSLYPSAARVLAHLCRAPGEISTHTELDEAADPDHFPREGGATVPQLVTFVRTMFADALEAGLLDEQELRDLVRDQLADRELREIEGRQLLRLLVENVRGVGYRLHLPPHEIEIVQI